MAEKRAVTMEKLVSLCKNRGFIFPGSEIYGGLANTWDYGPLGVELKNNVKKAWWKKFVQENPYNTGVDCAILMNTRTWKASGHLGGFSDPLMDCKACKARHRADDLVEKYAEKHKLSVGVEGMDNDALEAFIVEHKVPCPVCGNSDFTSIRKFNLMFKTFQGVTEDSTNTVYLRPETAQGIFVNFQNVQRSSRLRVPSGSGKSENPSATKSPQATSPSAPASSNRWSWSFSASRAPTSSGLPIGKTSAAIGCCPSA